MTNFSYALAASVLHDRSAVDKIFSDFEPFFAGLGGKRAEISPQGAPGAQSEPGALSFFFILTGGTEGIVLDYLSRRKAQASRKAPALVLMAHNRHNSLPAALEIAARVRQEGGCVSVIQIKSAGDKTARGLVEEAIRVNRAIEAMRNTKIGAVGRPSDWLVASSHSAAVVKASWGAALESVDIEELKAKMGELRKKTGESHEAPYRSFVAEASFCKEAQDEDLRSSEAVYRALGAIVKQRGLDALSLRCFDLLGLGRSTGCFALSQLADEGIDAGCEGDVPSVLALRWARLLTGRAAWMANPSEIDLDEQEGRGRLLLAHCTVPRSLLQDYGIRSHFESGIGVALAGRFAPGPVTLLRIGGAALDVVWIAEGSLVASPSDEGLCRTQAVVELPAEDLRKLLDKPLGNHLVLCPGHWARLARRYLACENIAEL